LAFYATKKKSGIPPSGKGEKGTLPYWKMTGHTEGKEKRGASQGRTKKIVKSIIKQENA